MENSIISEYYKTIFDKMKTDKLLGENGETLLLSKDDFCRYCNQIIRERELETLRSEVMVLENLANHYQERFNIIGLILSILVYTFFSRMFDLMLPPAMNHSTAVA